MKRRAASVHYLGSPRPADLLKTIRALVAKGKVHLTEHMLERLDERDLDIDDAMRVLKVGDIDGTIVPGRRAGEWKCVVRGKLKWSPREVGVATVVVKADKLIIATVEWMDK